MTIDKLLPEALLTGSIDIRRRARLCLYATLITTGAALLAALLMFYLGLNQTALNICYVIAAQLLGLLVLFATRSVKVASYYLLAVMFSLVIFDLGPQSEFSILALTAIPIISINLLGIRTGLVWSFVAVVWAFIINPLALGDNQFFIILSYGVGITTAGVTFAAIVVEVARAKAVIEAEIAIQQTQKQRERIWMFAEQTFPGIAEVNGGFFEYVNPGLCTLLGYQKEDLLHTDSGSLIHPDDYAEIVNTLVGVSGDGFRIEARVRHGEGHWMWVELYGIPYGTPEEDCWIIAAHDYSEIKQAHENLLQAQRLEGVGVLAAGVAHDFNNLLTVITGFGELLPSSRERREILNAAHEAAELTNQLMAFGQRGPMLASDIDAVQAINNLEVLFESLLGARVTLNLRLADEPLGIRINTNQFNQVALNIVKNAKESILDNGHIDISIKKVSLSQNETQSLSLTGENFVQIMVTDSGIGMSEKAVERAFDPFYSTKQPGGGSGLGLASTYGIVSQYGGSIKLHSKPGFGTTLTVHFPLVPFVTTTSNIEFTTHDKSVMPSLNILVVDDEENVRGLVSKILENAGHTISSAGDADEAFKIFQTNPIDLVVSDIVMPGIRGTELIEKLRDENPDLPALLISGYTNDDVNLWLEADLHTRFLAKPFRGEELIAQIHKLAPVATAV